MKHKHLRDRKFMVTFLPYATQLIQRKREAGCHNAADLYRTTRNHLLRLNGNRDIRLADISPGFVVHFIEQLRAEGLMPNSINTYASNLRAILNQARNEGLLPVNALNPFAHISLHREMSGSRALDEQTLGEIVGLMPEDGGLQRARDFCTFSFLACGMPFVDMAHLTHENIHGEELVYKRKKTGTLIRIHISDGMHNLLNKYERPDSPYLFPILLQGTGTTEAYHKAYKSALHLHNDSLHELGQLLAKPIHLTSYVIRHTWATLAHKKNTPMAVISQALGHTSEKTTRFYLAALDQSEIDKANRIVTGDIDRIVAKAG